MTDRRGFLASLLALVFGWKARRPHRPEFGSSATFALKMAENPVRMSDVYKRLMTEYYDLTLEKHRLYGLSTKQHQ